LDIRDKIEQCGDIVFDKISTFQSYVKDTFNQTTRGVVLTYNVQELQNEKDRLMKQVGRRVMILRKNNSDYSSLIQEDTILKKLFYKLDMIEDQIEESINERKMRLKT